MKNTESEKYILKLLLHGKTPEIPIAKSEFDELKNSQEFLQEARAFEEKYEIVIYNYLEIEKELINSSITQSVKTDSDLFFTFNYRLIINIKIANLLSSARLYTDSIKKNISSWLSEDENKIKVLLKNEYDNNLYYRVMHELRNYTQHVNYPIHTTLTGFRPRENNMLEYYTQLFFVKNHLSKDQNFKKKVLDEMEDEVNLLLYIRHYIESISKIHIATRELIEPKTTTARHCMEVAINRYEKVREMLKEDIVNFSAIRRNKDDELVEQFTIMLMWDDERIFLVKKNRSCLVDLNKKYATTRIN